MKTSIHDFSFVQLGYGKYRVIYESPQPGKLWSVVITDMTIIDATKNSDSPKIKDLNSLKRLCKL